MAYSQSMKKLVNKADVIGCPHVFDHCKPMFGIRDVITTYCKLILTR